MKAANKTLTKTDRQILESYKNLIAGLADYLGDGFEIVLHSLEDLDNSVIAIINGHYTGRTLGAPVTDLALNMLSQIEANGNRDHVSYFNRTRAAKPLKSTTIAIRGEKERVIGLLCINFYLETSLYGFMEHWMPSAEVNPHAHKNTPVVENFSDNTEELVVTALQTIRPAVVNDPSISAGAKNKKIIEQLIEGGLFNLKNSVETVSRQLGISKTTVYMHLRNLNNK